MSLSLNLIENLSEKFPAGDVNISSFASFLKSFPLQGDQLYTTLFARHANIVQTQKARFAVANLEKILTVTFEISSKSGFDKMSLRDLSKRTGMSMGAIYSCISKKEDIAMMVSDIVQLSSDLTRQHAMKATSIWSQIEQSIRYHLYASSLLQPWYFFLYFETRSLPADQQAESKRIEMGAIDGFTTQIEAGVSTGEFHADNAKMVANTIVVLLEDWYLKPWKNHSLNSGSRKNQEQAIDDYYQSLIAVVRKLLVVQ